MTDRLRAQQEAFRRAAIIRVAGEVLADSDCRSLTMAEVAERLGTSKATLYRYFSGREELLEQVIRQASDDAVDDALKATTGQGPKERTAEVARFLVERCLNTRGGDGVPLCCLAEVNCPFLDWGKLGNLLGFERSAWRGGGRVQLAHSVRALSAVVAAKRKAENKKPTRADVDAIVLVLVPDALPDSTE